MTDLMKDLKAILDKHYSSTGYQVEYLLTGNILQTEIIRIKSNKYIVSFLHCWDRFYITCFNRKKATFEKGLKVEKRYFTSITCHKKYIDTLGVKLPLK